MKVLKLKGKMVERGMNVDALATKIGIDRSTLYRKFKGDTTLTIGEAQKLKAALDLTNEEAIEIFFD